MDKYTTTPTADADSFAGSNELEDAARRWSEFVERHGAFADEFATL